MKLMEAVNCGTYQMKLTGSYLHNIKQSSALTCHQAMQNNPSLGNCVSFESSYNIRRSHLPITYCSHSSTDRNGSGRKSKFQVPAQKRKHIGKICYSADICAYDGNTFGVTSHDTEEKIGVLLLNLGGPDTLQDVQPFLFNLFADPDIIRLPRLFRFLQRPLAKLISVARAPKSRQGYAAIGGGSPLRRITIEQANALKVALEAKNVPVNVYVGMRYWYPFTEDAIHQIKKDKITRLVVLPLYPQFSISTSGSSIRLLKSIFREDSYLAGLPVSIIESWYEREGYIKSMADLIEKGLTNFSKSDEEQL